VGVSLLRELVSFVDNHKVDSQLLLDVREVLWTESGLSLRMSTHKSIFAKRTLCMSLLTGGAS
jgi:hypothetical protein